MARYNAEFENRIQHARAGSRLLVARGINYRALPAAFENACRERLSDPGEVQFFWRDPDQRWKRNPGFVMIAFESHPRCTMAEAELRDLVFQSRPIDIKRASKRAHQPFHLRTQSAASTSAAPTTTTIAEDLPTAASTIAAPAAATAASTTPTAVAATSAAPLTATPTTTLAVGPDLPAPTIAASTTAAIAPAAPIAQQTNRSSRVNRPFIIDSDDEHLPAAAPTPVTRQRSRGSGVSKQFTIDISDDTDDSQ